MKVNLDLMYFIYNKIMSVTKGRLAENMAKKYFIDKGLSFLGQNVRFGYDEIDLLFKDKLETIVVLEVRYKNKEYSSLLEVVPLKKIKTISRVYRKLEHRHAKIKYLLVVIVGFRKIRVYDVETIIANMNSKLGFWNN